MYCRNCKKSYKKGTKGSTAIHCAPCATVVQSQQDRNALRLAQAAK